MEPCQLELELERHHLGAFGWAMSCCHWDRSRAEDVLQATYLKILDGRARFGGRSAFRTWLFAVIRRTAQEQRARAALRRFVTLAGLEQRPQGRDPAPDPATALTRSESSAQLLDALARLPRRQRELLHLVFYQDLSVAGAAEVLGVSVGTARTHYERGKAGLRRLLAREAGP